MWFLTLIILLPIYMVVINSFKNRTEAAMMNIALPSSWHIFENYKEMIIEGGVIRGFFNSVIVTGVSEWMPL